MIRVRDRHILTDADGVLVNWNRGFVEFMTKRGFPQLPDTDGYYNITDRHNVTYEEAGLHIKEFNESPDIANLQAFGDAVEYVGKLANLGFRFTVVTSLSSDPEAKAKRTANLHNLYGNVFNEIVCLHQGAKKFEELTRWQNSELFWIEDHPDQAKCGHDAGLRPILIKHPYNANFKTDLFPAVEFESPWKQIYEIICEDYGLNK